MEHSIAIRDTGITVTRVLEDIAQGFAFHQIVERHPKLTISDIMASAKFAADLIAQHVKAEDIIEINGAIILRANNSRIVNLAEIRKEYPRAYEKWEPNEDNELASLFKSRLPFEDMSKALKRQPGAVRSRLVHLGLIGRR
ncbi:MAG: DUF433 domain-containing protein [candidate division Zixibacteria bacterium]|nr:DUF433 domain-containing protein [candidate division Zixibacteria bacterium]